MVRERLLGRRWLVHALVAWGMAIAAAPCPGEAAPLPPGSEIARAGDLESRRAWLEHKVIRAELAALGLSPADAAVALERLTPEERSELAARAEELAAGGDSVGFLAFAIILALLVILVLELLGRRVISRP